MYMNFPKRNIYNQNFSVISWDFERKKNIVLSTPDLITTQWPILTYLKLEIQIIKMLQPSFIFRHLTKYDKLLLF